MDPVKGSVLIVGVGASQGLGAAIARRFAREGYPVVIAGRSPDKLEATLGELRASGAKAEAIAGDATLAADVERFVEVAGRLSPIAVAVHNAGGNEPAPFLKVTEERFTRHWREHALGGFLLAQAAIPKLLAQAAARCSSPVPRAACAARRISHLSHPPKPQCATWRRASRANTARRTSMSATSWSTAASPANAC